MANTNLPVEQTYRTLMIVWFALFMSQMMFFVVVFLAKPELYQFDLAKPIFGETAPVILICIVFAISNLAFSLFLGKKFIDRAVEERRPALIQTAMIMGCALSESVSLIGIFLAFAVSYQYFFFWILLGLFGMTLHYPKRAHLHEASFDKTI